MTVLAEFEGGGPLDGASLLLEDAPLEYREQDALYRRAPSAEGRTQDGYRIYRYHLVEEEKADA